MRIVYRDLVANTLGSIQLEDREGGGKEMGKGDWW
jgi:hypothetical protein